MKNTKNKGSIASWIHSYFDNVMTKFMINNRTDAWKTDVNLLIGSYQYGADGFKNLGSKTIDSSIQSFFWDEWSQHAEAVCCWRRGGGGGEEQKYKSVKDKLFINSGFL